MRCAPLRNVSSWRRSNSCTSQAWSRLGLSGLLSAKFWNPKINGTQRYRDRSRSEPPVWKLFRSSVKVIGSNGRGDLAEAAIKRSSVDPFASRLLIRFFYRISRIIDVRDSRDNNRWVPGDGQERALIFSALPRCCRLWIGSEAHSRK